MSLDEAGNTRWPSAISLGNKLSFRGTHLRTDIHRGEITNKERMIRHVMVTSGNFHSFMVSWYNYFAYVWRICPYSSHNCSYCGYSTALYWGSLVAASGVALFSTHPGLSFISLKKYCKIFTEPLTNR